MSKAGDDLFASYQKYKSKMVDSPSYEPLGQRVVIKGMDEEEKKKRLKEYHKRYYQKNKERIRKNQRKYWREEHKFGNHRGDMIGNQKRVYEYLLEQYREGKDLPRGTQIARELGITEKSVYTAVFNLTKKGYVGRGSYGRYLLLKFPDGDKPVNEFQDSKDSEKLIASDKDYKKLIEMNKELKEELKECKKQKEELELQVNNSISHIEGLMESKETLEKKNLSLRGQVDELKGVVKVLLKYFQ